MARRKKNTINLKDLKIYPQLLEELQAHPDYAEKDLSTLTLTVFDSYEAVIVDVDKAISSLKRYVALNKKSIQMFHGEQIITRYQLAKMLGISRQTLTTWINKGFITPLKSRHIPSEETFYTDVVLQELENYKNRSSDK